MTSPSSALLEERRQSSFSACARSVQRAGVSLACQPGHTVTLKSTCSLTECCVTHFQLLRCRPEVVHLIRDKYDDLGGWPPPSKLPVLYNACYNIGFWGLEKLHPFDSKKFQRVLAILEEGGVLSAEQLVEAREAGREVLREVHTEMHLNKLDSSSFKVAQVSERARGHWPASKFRCTLDLLSCGADRQSWHA